MVKPPERNTVRKEKEKLRKAKQRSVITPEKYKDEENMITSGYQKKEIRKHLDKQKSGGERLLKIWKLYEVWKHPKKPISGG
jgi:hypothetical protein